MLCALFKRNGGFPDICLEINLGRFEIIRSLEAIPVDGP